jgi:hypothetical protein
MSRRKHQRRLEEHYRSQLAPLVGSAGVCVLLMLAIYIATMPL